MTGAGSPGKGDLRERSWETFKEYAEALVVALVLALVIRTYVVQAFKIPSGSMEPTLLIGDHILVNKFLFTLFRPPERSEVIVFEYPEDPSKDFIKRVIATGGDVLEEREKKLYLNGGPASDPWAYHGDPRVIPPQFSPRDTFGSTLVPPDSFFMMGDNRDNSHDSRWWKFVRGGEIRGRAFLIYFSWDDAGALRWRRFLRLIR